MQIKYNITGNQRKALVASIRSILNDLPRYQGAPSFAYTIGAYTIDKNGTVSCPDDHDADEVRNLVLELKNDGFISEVDAIQAEPATVVMTEPIASEASMCCAEHEEIGELQIDLQRENSMQPEDSETDAVASEVTTICGDRLSIGIPRDGLTDAGLNNLRLLIASKAGLLQRALGSEHLPIEVDEHKIYFDWFPAPSSPDETDAYTKLATALINMAKAQKRVTAVERETENEKYAFRCFLLRLGFIGKEFKAGRKILLRNLTGNGAFKAPHETEASE